MPFVAQNYINGQGVVDAAWLNGVDRMVFNVLGGWQGQTVPIVLAALGLPSGLSLPLPISEGGTGQITAPAALAALGGVSASQVGANIWPRSQAEIDAGVVPVTENFVWGDGRRYGADPTGTVDSTMAINQALSCNSLVYLISGLYLISSTLNAVSGQTLYGDGSATNLQYANAGIDGILMSNLTGTVVRDLKITVTGAPAAVVGGIHIQLCTNCKVQRVEMTGCKGYGVWIDCSNYGEVSGSYFHNFGDGVVSNYGDISIVNNVSTTAGAIGNKILDNQCLGGNNEFGIAIGPDDFATTLTGFASHTVVDGNIVGPHTGYGLLMYMPGGGAPACDTYNTFANNHVFGILGSIASNPSSGAGIYIVGLGIGAAIVIGNTVENSCIDTTNPNLAPAGIGINGVQTGITRPVVANNCINGMTQGNGILVTSSPGGAVLGGNSINMPSTNNGSGPGGSSLIGNGISVFNSSNMTIAPNDVQVYGSGGALALLATAGNITDFNISGGQYITAGAGSGFTAAQAGGFTIGRLTVNGGKYQTSFSAIDAIKINAVVVGQFNGVDAASGGGGRAFFNNGCTQIRVGGGSTLTTTGAVAVGTSGTCTGSFIDKSVYFGGVSSLVSNAGTGCIIEWYVLSSTVPTTGTFAVGDHAIPVAPVVGSPKGWYTTVAGTPGTQTSEGNL